MIAEIFNALSDTMAGFALILIIVGLVLAFFGSEIFHMLVFVVGGIVFSLLAVAVTSVLFPGSFLCLIGAGIIGFIIGGFLALILLYAAIFFVGFIIGGIIGFALTGMPLVGLICALVGGIALVILFIATIEVLTAIQGGLFVWWGVYLLTGSTEMALATGIVVAAAGAVFQMFVLGREEEGREE